jgi:protein-S-isoprenylcysteine O-methyltransferase Ste14
MMATLEAVRGWAWLVVLGVSLLIGVLTLRKVKLGTGAGIAFALFRTAVFFGMLCLPLIDQPRLSVGIVFPLSGLVLLVSGLFLILSGGRELTKTQLVGVRGIPEKLITTGPYARIRHPLNLGLLLAFPGWFLLWGGEYSLVFPPVLIVVLVFETFWEEGNLLHAFGEEYRDYRERVGMFFPRIGGSGRRG